MATAGDVGNEPTYIGDYSETPDGSGHRTLHINHPNGCACPDAVAARLSDGAAFFWSKTVAVNAGFANMCTSCAAFGTHCSSLLS